jgi:hypothetical protein
MNLEKLTTIEKRVLAESGDTDTSILIRLAKDRNSYVRRAAQESLQSSNYSQKLPEDWRELSETERISRLNSQPTDSDILEILAVSKSWRIRQAVACNESTPDSILRLLTHDDDSDVRQVAIDKLLPSDWRSLDDERRVRRLSSETVPSDTVEALSNSENWEIRQQCASNPGATKETLDRLKKDGDSDVALAAKDALLSLRLPKEWRQIKHSRLMQRLKDGAAPTQVLEVLATSSNWLTRQAVARNEATPASLLEKLARDDDSSVRQAATVDRQLPPDWRYLSNEARVKRISKTDVLPESLEPLARSSDWRLRQAVASKAGLSIELLKELAQDRDSDVASTASEALMQRRLPVEWRTIDVDQKIDRVNKGQASEDVLEILSLSASQNIRRAVSSSLTTPENCLRRLMDDRDDEIRQVAKETLILKLLPEDWVNLDDREIVENLKRESVPQESLQALAMSDARCIRDAVALNRNATIPILLTMREDLSTPARIQKLIRRTWAKPLQTNDEPMH